MGSHFLRDLATTWPPSTPTHQELLNTANKLDRLHAENKAFRSALQEANGIEAALRAEVERLREALQSICQRYCYAYQNLAWTEMGSEYYSAYCIAAQAIQLTQPLPAPPDAG